MDILVVDDDAKMLESIRIGLESSGHCVFEALSSKQALDQLGLEGSGICMVVTDYLMPEMNGIDLLKAIRRNRLHLPVIIMTAYAEKGMVIEAFNNGCDSLIEKPFRLDQLVVEIEKIRIDLLRNPVSYSANPINTPLSVISESANWIRLNPKYGDRLKQHATKILNSVNRIRRIMKESGLEEKPFCESLVNEFPCRSSARQVNAGGEGI